MGSKQCKDYYLDWHFYLAFHKYIVGKVWDNKGGLGSSAKVIYAIKFCKAVSVREWHTSSSPEEYEYSKVLLTDLWVQLALIESADLYWSYGTTMIDTVFNSTLQWFWRTQRFNSISFSTAFYWLCFQWIIGWRNTSPVLL